MGTTKPACWPHGRHESIIYEEHSEFGYYVYSRSTNLWTQLRERSGGRKVYLRCRERSPSPNRLALWKEIDTHLDDLERKAVASIPDPKDLPRHLRFRREDLSLGEVRLETDNEFELFFDTPVGDKLHQWPVVTFVNWNVTEAEWAT